MRTISVICAAALFVVVFALGACSDSALIVPSASADVSDEGRAARGEFIITFEYKRQSGSASNQFAVWIEDADGRLIKTLYATLYTVGGGYKSRPDSIPVWVEKSSLRDKDREDFDAITGATPRDGTLTYIWDLTDDTGADVSPGTYTYCIEATLRWKNRVYFTGTVDIGEIAEVTDASAEYVFEADGGHPALTGSSAETRMIRSVTAVYRPGD